MQVQTINVTVRSEDYALIMRLIGKLEYDREFAGLLAEMLDSECPPDYTHHYGVLLK